MNITGNEELRDEAKERVNGWLSKVVQLMNEGRINSLVPDPFYPRKDLITKEVIWNVLNDIVTYLEEEINTYPGYHNHTQGIGVDEYLVIPEFLDLPLAQQRAIVYGIDRIMQEYRTDFNGRLVHPRIAPAVTYSP